MIAKLIRGLSLMGCVLFFATAAVAVTLDAYKSKIDASRKSALELETSMRDEINTQATVHDFVALIRKDFPADERVEWESGSVETTSAWLLEKVRILDGETDSTKRLPEVVEIREYLSTILFKLDELEHAASAERTKDRDKQKLGEILRREEYQKPPEKQESLIQRWLRAFFEWLEGFLPKSSGQPPTFSGLGFLTVVFQVLIYGALLALLGFLLYKFVPVLFPALRRAPKPKKKKDRVILGEQLGEDETALDLFAEAERLAREGNLRGAIRKGYIALLCDLSDRKVIGLARNKTNRDYLRDVRSRGGLHSRMKSVTDTFEKHWYGSQESVDQDWTRFREEYQEAIRSV